MKVFDPLLLFSPRLLKDKDQIERFSIYTHFCTSNSFIEDLFRCIPANLTHFCAPFSVDQSPLQLREDLTKIIANNETLLKCKVIGENTSWKFEEITDRNKRLKNEQRFKVMKVAPQQHEAAEEQITLSKRREFVCDDSDPAIPNKKSKH